MRTQNSARRLTAQLNSLHVRYKNALRVVLPAGVTRPTEVADLGPSAVACTRSTLTAQTDLARAIFADVERLAAKSRRARTVYERLREEVRDRAICNAIASGGVEIELSAIEARCGIMAVLAASAFALAGDHDLSRSILDTVRHQSIMTRGRV